MIADFVVPTRSFYQTELLTPLRRNDLDENRVRLVLYIKRLLPRTPMEFRTSARLLDQCRDFQVYLRRRKTPAARHTRIRKTIREVLIWTNSLALALAQHGVWGYY